MFQIITARSAVSAKNNESIYLSTGSAAYTLFHFYSTVNLSVNGETITAKPHACMLYAPNTPQYFAATTTLVYDELHFVTSGTPLSDITRANAVYYPPEHLRVSGLVKEIGEELITESPYRTEIMSLKVEELLILLSRAANSEGESTVNHKLRQKLTDVRTFVFSHLNEEWTVEKMAARIDMSASHFHSVYRKLFGKTPTDDLIDARVYAAQLALTFSDEPLTAIAARLGYHSLSHFVRQYSAVQGCSPAKYRRMCAGKHVLRTKQKKDEKTD